MRHHVQLSLSAGGSPASVRESLRAQATSQLGTVPDLAKDAVAQAVLGYVDEELPGGDQGTVSVSVSLWIGITPTSPAIPPVADAVVANTTVV